MVLALSRKSGNRTKYSNNTWFRLSDPYTSLIFVHGLLSSSDSCWRSSEGIFWPELIAADKDFLEASIFLGGYHTSVNSGKYDIAQCVAELVRALKLTIARYSAPISSRNIVFICHSLGGVVVRRMLEEHQRLFRDKNISIILVASPTMGSAYAASFRKIASAYGHKVAEQLLPNSDALKDIDDRFRRLIADNEFASLTGAEIVEHRGPVLIKGLPFRTAPIVSASSASRYFGPTTLIAGTDHFSIAKPTSVNHETHRFLREFFIDKIHPLQGIPIAADKTSAPTAVGTPLFDVYQSCHGPYYVTRTEDSALAQTLAASSAWLSGPSGVGKTTLAKRWIDLNGYKPIEISLSRLAGSENCEEDLLLEIRESLYQSGIENTNATYNGTVEALVEQSYKSVVPIFLDEVPLSAGAHQTAFATGIGDLLDAVKRRTQTDVRFLVCSINAPTPEMMNGKMREQFELISLDRWKDEDLEALLATIASKLSTTLTPAMHERVINEANGSPRFIKMFFRKAQLSQSNGSQDFELALEHTKIAMREIQ